MSEPAQSEPDLLGDPRLKNGLTYYPGVRLGADCAVVGNVCRLNLTTDDDIPYTGYWLECLGYKRSRCWSGEALGEAAQSMCKRNPSCAGKI